MRDYNTLKYGGGRERDLKSPACVFTLNFLKKAIQSWLTAANSFGVGVGDDRLRQVRLGGLEQSSNGESVVQVVGIKVGFLENRPSLDATVCKEVDQESRDITGLSTREALGAQVAEGLVLGGAMHGLCLCLCLCCIFAR